MRSHPRTRTDTVTAVAVLQAPPTLDRLLQQLAPISLAAMGDVALLRRADTKMLLAEDKLRCVLSEISDDYKVLEIEGRRLHRYQTVYFDTPDYSLYHQHQNGQRSRYKVRIRSYIDSGLYFLEVKQKTNQDLTLKKRLQVPESMHRIDERGSAFLAATFPYPAATLVPTLYSAFRRVTLVSRHSTERVTVDTDLSYYLHGNEFTLAGIAIVEVKQPSLPTHSPFIEQLRALGVRPMSFSKYCLGVAALVPQVKHNRFKPQQLVVQRLMEDAQHRQAGVLAQ